MTNYRPISLLSLNYQIYPKESHAIKLSYNNNEKQSAAIENKTILHALSIICDVVDMSNKKNKNLSAIPQSLW